MTMTTEQIEALKREVSNKIPTGAGRSYKNYRTAMDYAIGVAINHLAATGRLLPDDAIKLINNMAEQWTSDECRENKEEVGDVFEDAYNMFVREVRKLKAMLSAFKGV